MNIRAELNRQRVKHIVSSYQLDGDESVSFGSALDELLSRYPHGLIELALVETLLDVWITVPLVRGMSFLKQVQQKLRVWEEQPICSTLTPAQFSQITGLDPSPIFGSGELPPSCPIQAPS
ncbi:MULTISPECIES: hypothetical protein [unclassified Leptolyngbya]|uniref:hypothetical protein n=1 Tax=unclassified Leptolyngbya TaxID=2650499 RepID=UPI001687630B|nr:MULTISPECIES: hypothetical protein [unclassified Leptolyngbya]MBD1911817.1 hypothetical protein [Leptolyngbya sp. FACHB-8]MBD2153293.1 hypothetical protein [Leptolyngbya sp. FACHB-16]